MGTFAEFPLLTLFVLLVSGIVLYTWLFRGAKKSSRVVCRACGAEQPPQARYCRQCGQEL